MTKRAKLSNNQQRLSLAPLTPEQALKQMFGAQASQKSGEPEQMVPRTKAKRQKK